ncbi:lgrC, partial [Symbiodinium sp. KB8]
LLDRDRLKDPANGVKYFKSFLRPLFVKGAANVFLYRFQQFMNMHRGNGDMLRWITRFQLSVNRNRWTMAGRQDSQWQDQYWDDWSWYESEESYAAKGKGKKGKKGKGKGKFSKDGKDGKSGKDGQSQLAEASSSSVTAATTFYAEYINPLNFSFMATEDKKEEAFISQPLTPTAMVLDLGCTRAMASRVAARFCDDNPNCGIWYTIAETMSQFTFANSESTKRKQKLIICMYDREYAVQSTEFDIVEQGHVPILMSLPQMRNLRLHLAHTWYLISLTSEPKDFVFATDDEWVIDEASMELIRAVPIPLEYLDNKRKTITELSKGKNVLRIEPLYRLRQDIPPVERLDLLMKNLAKVSLKTAQREQEHPESLHQERSLVLPLLLKMIRIFKSANLPCRKNQTSRR